MIDLRWLLALRPDQQHVIPMTDLREHDFAPDCWCHPVEDAETPDLWAHNSLDGREHTYEAGALQ